MHYILTYIHYTTLHYITLHYITIHYNTLHYITLHYIHTYYNTLQYITLHYITLDYIPYIHTYLYTYIYIYVYIYIYTEIRFNYWAQHNFLFVVARLLAFKHHFLLHSCCYDLGFRTLLLLTFQHSSLYCVCCCSALDFQILLPTTFLLLYSWLSNTTTCFFVATLSTFKHYFLLRSCCYALGFPT